MKNSKRVYKTIIKNILKIVLILSLIYNIIFVIGHEINNKFNIKIAGIEFFSVAEKTMKPTINKNDVIFVKKTKDISENDIIAFYNNSELKIKRIIKTSKRFNEEFYTTKGDNNYYVDPDEVSKLNIEGKIVGKIKYIGFIINILQAKWLTVVITIFLILMALYNRNKIKKEERRKKLKKIHNEKKK